jgi:hypothetical protein
MVPISLAFWAELSGIYYALLETHNFGLETEYTVYCDNQAVIRIRRLKSMKADQPKIS